MLFKISGIIFFLWAILIICLYYTKNTSHLWLISDTSIWVIISYFAIIFTLYAIYKFFSENNQVTTKYSIVHIFAGFFVSLFVMCGLYVTIEPQMSSGASLWTKPNAFVLFFHILQFLVYPIFLVFLWKAIGSSIMCFFANWKDFPIKLRIPIETALGMFIFVMMIFFLGYFGIFTLNNLIILVIFLSIVSFFGWKNTYNEIKNQRIIISNSPISSETITAEITFLLFVSIVSISFLNILRPMPIGWDDLGVYMNFPRIIANFGGLLEGSAMYSWQLVTATGFLFEGSAPQAFFINQIGGIIATIAIISFLSLLLEGNNSHKTRRIIALPILLGIVYYIMPMTIFHQAKDMKLDPALMFISATAFVTLFFAIQNFFRKNHKNALILFFIAGLLTGFAFSIKFTTLIFIISAFSYISYILLGFAGLIGFTGIFIAIFTQLGLWSQLFVWMPENTQNIVIFSLIVGIVGFFTAIKNFQENIFKYIQFLWIFSIGMILSISPWIVKNFSELNGNISISGLLNGASSKNNSEWSTFYTDYSKIFSDKELEKRRAENNNSTTNADGVSLNEDFARYFGQETGLNNYLKLPTNLTLQNNQKWEFTDITYIFLAFVPVILFFFINFSHGNKKKIFFSGMFFFLVLGVISVIISLPNPNFLQILLTSLLSKITLPTGYIVLLALVFGFLTLIHFTLSNKKIRGILVFLAIYGLVFWISAFGIVWYGVMIYFLFLLIITLGANEFNTVSENDTTDTITIKNIFSYGFYLLLGIYLFVSAPLHAFSNLQNAGYSEFKYYNLSQNSAIFSNKWDYFIPLVELNLKDPENITKNTLEKLQKSAVGKIFEKEKNTNVTPLNAMHEWFIWKIHEAMSLGYQKNLYKKSSEEQIAIISTNKNISNTQKNSEIQKIRTNLANIEKEIDAMIQTSAEQIRIADPIMNELYTEILSPKKDNKNTWAIYRVGTFFTYFIQNNRSRFFEDSLLTNFQTYFYEENPKMVAEKMKKIGLSYVLLDLNAATIDSKEANISALETGRASLTTRYENILNTLRDDSFSLVHTDNICLRLAIDEYKKWKLVNREEFLNIAGTNYTHYAITNNSLKPVSRGQIAQNCAEYINDLVNKKDKSYSYLSSIFSAKTQEEYINTITQLTGKQSYFALFEINE